MAQDSFESLLDEAPLLSEPSIRGDLFLPASHLRLLEKLEHLSRYSHFVQVVVGLPGSGKTTLVKQFTPGEDESDVHACLIRGSAGLTAVEVLRQMVDQLSLEVAADAKGSELLSAVIEHASLLAQIPRSFLIVVDDAEELSESALALLFRLLEQVTDADAKPHLVLFGAPRLKEVLKAEPFKSVMTRSAHLVELDPLSFEEMQDFIAHRFGSGVDELTDRELKKLYNDTFGLPGRIPAVLERMLGSDQTENAAQPTARSAVVVRSAVMLALIAVPMVAGALWFGLQPGSTDSRVRVELPAPAVAARPQLPAVAIEKETLDQRLERVRAALEREHGQQRGSAAPLVAPKEALPTANEVASTVEKKAAESDVALAQLPVAPVKIDAVEPVTVPRKRVLALPPPADAPAGAEDAPVVVADEANGGAHPLLRERELLDWSPSGYTLQMLGARKESSVEGFIRAQKAPERFYYFSTIYKDKPWYVVVYGNYDDRSEAVAAVADLPLVLRKRRPWARSVQGVQEDIRRKK